MRYYTILHMTQYTTHDTVYYTPTQYTTHDTVYTIHRHSTHYTLHDTLYCTRHTILYTTDYRLYYAILQYRIELRLTLHSTQPHYITLHLAPPHCTPLYCTAPCSTTLHHTVLHCTRLYCTALHCTAPYCTAWHGTELYCTATHLLLPLRQLRPSAPQAQGTAARCSSRCAFSCAPPQGCCMRRGMPVRSVCKVTVSDNRIEDTAKT